MNAPTYDQISGPLERVVYVALGWFVAQGFITSVEVGNYATLILGIFAAFYGWWLNRPKAILQSAAAIPGTTVMTQPSLANSTPEANIVSTSENKIVSK